jgi:predicted ATPase/class 3 adenylate cyclase
MGCPSCGADNRADAKFCRECGSPLAARCPSCGAANEPGQKFCDECGAALAAQPKDLPPQAPQPSAERRLVSVLFADLVGFTTLSETRDAEEVRELLSRYFDTCKRLISLYGGTVEKFIGDAVMAVWGTPIAQEDDAERAVRTALDLVQAITQLGEEVGAPELRARAGVLTGEAAVTIGAEAEGMVAGDLVNTASRIQSAAQPGTVLVGEATKRSTEAAIAYEDAGAHELKGKAEPVQLYRALRVTASRRGALKFEGLEPPFVGRDSELRLVKELFHASDEEKRAQLVSVIGLAGIGKSRLAWEFEKYIDGLAENVRWHRGRCLAYGEGVAYWALAEMLRMRAGITEEEAPEPARAKLAEAVALQVTDPEERAWVEPRIAHLLGLEQGISAEREDLFSAWRLFFERMAERQPTVLVFEDLQWADTSLLDFIEYLLEWSRSHPLYVVTLARPELADRRPGWGADKRNFSALYLEPLGDEPMNELLQGMVPGLPEKLRAEILARAEGVPLYAVETVRMLLDRGLLERAGDTYQLTGPVETLDVPETLHALIAARLDGLEPAERRIVQDASVLGKTFSREGLAAVNGTSDVELERLLAGLVRKEVLSVQADPRSPERGQYGFLQDLLKRVAYETLARKERKGRHLAAAAFLERAWGGEGEQEVVEVVASHYLDAYEAAPDADDGQEIKGKAREMLARAGERAASLAATTEAQRYFERAAELADEPTASAGFLDRAGQMAAKEGTFKVAERLFEAAIGLYEAEGETHAAARVSGRLGVVEQQTGRLEQAIERMERALSVVTDEPDEDVALVAARVAVAHWYAGNLEKARKRCELALEIAESLWVPEALSRAFTTKAFMAATNGRLEEERALLRHALEIALENDLPELATMGYNNLSDKAFKQDRYADALDYQREALALARREGDRVRERFALCETTYPLHMTGRWDEAVSAFAEIPEEAIAGSQLSTPLNSVLEIHINRGDLDEARRLLSLYAYLDGTADVIDRAFYAGGRAALYRGEGTQSEALEAGTEALEAAAHIGYGSQPFKQGFVEAVEAAQALGDDGRAEELLTTVESLPRGYRPPYLEAQASRLRARLTSDDSADSAYKSSAALFRELGTPFWLAVTLLEHGEWLVESNRADAAQPLLAESRELFERLEAKPWLERLARAGGEPVEAGVSG